MCIDLCTANNSCLLNAVGHVKLLVEEHHSTIFYFSWWSIEYLLMLKYHLNQFGAGCLIKHITLASQLVTQNTRDKSRTCNNLSCKVKHNLDSALRLGRLRPSVLMLFEAFKFLESLLNYVSICSEGKMRVFLPVVQE